MKKFKFSLEYLDKRLSPSDLIALPVDCPPRSPSGGTAPAPPPGNGEPPIEDPNIPVGPSLPV